MTPRRPPTDPTLAVVYCRASTEAQEIGPVAQSAACERWAAANGARIVATHTDQGVSGAAPIAERVGFLAAIDALKTHNAGILLVSRRDRIARDVVLAAMAERLAERNGARVMMADGAGNGAGPEAALMRSLLDSFSAYERLLVASRTKAALAVKRSRGERLGGHVPFGASCPDGVHLVENATECATIARMRALRAGGCSLRRVGSTLMAEGMRPRNGGTWSASTVQKILNRVGAG